MVTIFSKPRSWDLWRNPRRAVIWILLFEVGVLVAVGATLQPFDARDSVLAVGLASQSVAFSFICVKWEGVRRLLVAGAEYGIAFNLLAIWDLAAALTLPTGLAVAVVLVSALADRPVRGVIGLTSTYRFCYSTSGTILSVVVAGQIRHEFGAQLFWLIPAAVGYVLVSPIVIGAVMVCLGQFSALPALLNRRLLQIEALCAALAICIALADQFGMVAIIWLSVLVALFVQRRAVNAELHREAPPDERPMVAEAWQLVAREVVSASAAAAVMRIDTGDPAAVALVARIQAGCDAIGQNGPNGLAILLTDCPGPNADAIAARMRSALQGNKIEANVAVAAKPRDGQSLADLLAVSEAELIAMDAATRSARSLRPDA